MWVAKWISCGVRPFVRKEAKPFWPWRPPPRGASRKSSLSSNPVSNNCSVPPFHLNTAALTSCPRSPYLTLTESFPSEDSENNFRRNMYAQAQALRQFATLLHRWWCCDDEGSRSAHRHRVRPRRFVR